MENQPLHSVSGKTLRIADDLKALEVGDVVTYSHLTGLIDVDVQEKGRGYLASAIRRVERDRPGTHFGCVRGVGIKRLTADEAAELGPAAIGTVRRKATRASKRLTRIDIDKLSDAQKVKHGLSLAVLGCVNMFTKSTNMKKVEQRVRDDGKIDVPETVRLFQS